MTALSIARSDMPLEDLVVRVCHMELTECLDEAEFREGVQLVLRNLDEVLDALCFYRPPERRIQRAVDRVKLKAAHMRNLCTAVPESFDHPESWRSVAENIMVNYEQFRIEAGLLYRLAVPGSSFGVLRAAL
jgi:signal recognition particle subunit SEC65